MAKRTLALVMGGGGARGALQVGAVRALLEADYRPDLLVGTSIGAANAAFLAVNGFTTASIDRLEVLWAQAAAADLLPRRYLWVTVRSLVGRRTVTDSELRLRNFYVQNGVTPEMRFGDVSGIRLIMIASDLNSGQTVLYGTSPEHRLLEGMLASAALPPWMRPIRDGKRLMIDGGFLSVLPIEAALSQGATEIVALDLADPYAALADTAGLRPGLRKMIAAVQQHETNLEVQLAAAYDVPVRRIEFRQAGPLPQLWDFSRTSELIGLGYAYTKMMLAARQPLQRTRWWTARDWLARSAERIGTRRRGGAEGQRSRGDTETG